MTNFFKLLDVRTAQYNAATKYSIRPLQYQQVQRSLVSIGACTFGLLDSELTTLANLKLLRNEVAVGTNYGLGASGDHRHHFLGGVGDDSAVRVHAHIKHKSCRIFLNKDYVWVYLGDLLRDNTYQFILLLYLFAKFDQTKKLPLLLSIAK